VAVCGNSILSAILKHMESIPSKMASTIISRALQSSYSKLEGIFYSGELLSHLYSRECVTTEEKQQVSADATQIERSMKLLDILIAK
jgi:hypothetical protein